MHHVLRPGSDPGFAVTDVLGGIPRCVLVLESAVRRVLTDFWDDSSRRKALDLVRTITPGCRSCGFRESSGILRSMTTLLSLSQAATVGIQLSIAERLLELIDLLKGQSTKLRN